MQRVVITGVGALTPIGLSMEETWKGFLEGRCGVARVNCFDPEKFSSHVAAEVKDFSPDPFIEPRESKKMDRFVQFAMAASQMAVTDSGIDFASENMERAGVYIGSGIGGISTIEKQKEVMDQKGPRRISPFLIPMLIINIASGMVSIRFGLKGPNSSCVTACATGNHAIGDAMRIIQYGKADVMVAGGSEAAITPLGFGGFCSMKALSTRNDAPEKASRPFDKDRDGFVMGEGAGVVILESLEHAQARGARIYAELVGYGMTGDAHHITQPAPEGEGAQRAMKVALDDAGLPLEAVEYINAHGTSTHFNDLNETIAIRKVFGAHADKLVVSSTKSMVGHLLGAAGGVETIATALSLYHGVIPPTINLDEPGEQCDLDYCPHEARKKEFEIGMTNSFGFGGHNAVLVLKKIAG